MTSEECVDVLIAGAGPAGLLLAMVLRRFGINVKIVDDRPNSTSSGKADGIQPKTIETLKQLRLAEPLLRDGVKIYDICFWDDSKGELARSKREPHFPGVDLIDPYILLVHQGMVEDLFLKDMQSRGLIVNRSTTFDSYEISQNSEYSVTSKLTNPAGPQYVHSKFLIGTDGAHSKVRKSMSATMDGESSDSYWGVIDGELDTDFPDFWSKCVLHTSQGTVLAIPRERGLTRLYIELTDTKYKEEAEAYVRHVAQKMISPFKLEWKSVEWFSLYRVGQRVASKFSEDNKVFIVGDSSHTHSPKAAQGLNTSVHDSWNLAWKIALSLRGANDSLLLSYENERRKIGKDLIRFDQVHAKAFETADPVALAQNFKQNVKFISGFGCEYDLNDLNVPFKTATVCALEPGKLLIPASATRYIDANPVQLEIDIPIRCQFRIYTIVKDIKAASKILSEFSKSILASQFSKNLNIFKNFGTTEGDLLSERRYTPESSLITFGLITNTPKEEFELADLPVLYSPYKWTVYLDNLPDGPSSKWKLSLSDNEIALLIVRPDGYIGTLSTWSDSEGSAASQWLSKYFSKIIN